MIKENKRILMITSLIILLPVLVGLLLWHQLPEQIPVHFNSEGVADSYQSKLWGVTFIYLVIFACHWFAAIITSVDPRRKISAVRFIDWCFGFALLFLFLWGLRFMVRL